MKHELVILGWPADFPASRPRTVVVPGTPWQFKTQYVGVFYETDREVTEVVLCPDPLWLAEFMADCDHVERRGKKWRCERDGYVYHIPREWGRHSFTSRLL